MPKTTQPPRRGAKSRAPRGWRPKFLAALAETSNVAKSARTARIDVSTVYRLRREDSSFAREWREALAEGVDTLEMDLLQRAREGRLEGGPKQARRSRVWDNAVGLRLLAVHRDTVARQRATRDDRDEAAVYAALDRKIETIRARLVKARAMKNAALAERANDDE